MDVISNNISTKVKGAPRKIAEIVLNNVLNQGFAELCLVVKQVAAEQGGSTGTGIIDVAAHKFYDQVRQRLQRIEDVVRNNRQHETKERDLLWQTFG